MGYSSHRTALLVPVLQLVLFPGDGTGPKVLDWVVVVSLNSLGMSALSLREKCAGTALEEAYYCARTFPVTGPFRFGLTPLQKMAYYASSTANFMSVLQAWGSHSCLCGCGGLVPDGSRLQSISRSMLKMMVVHSRRIPLIVVVEIG